MFNKTFKVEESKPDHTLVAGLLLFVYLCSVGLSGFSIMWLIGFLFVVPFGWESWISKTRHCLLGKTFIMLALIQVWLAICMFF